MAKMTLKRAQRIAEVCADPNVFCTATNAEVQEAGALLTARGDDAAVLAIVAEQARRGRALRSLSAELARIGA